jgi:hypothetical protein
MILKNFDFLKGRKDLILEQIDLVFELFVEFINFRIFIGAVNIIVH